MWAHSSACIPPSDPPETAPTIADFENARPREYSVTFATGSDPRRPTQFEVAQYGIYVSDQWRVNDAVALTSSIRTILERGTTKVCY